MDLGFSMMDSIHDFDLDAISLARLRAKHAQIRPPKSRKSTAHACDPCRLRKIKCTQEDRDKPASPCSSCLKSGKACTYSADVGPHRKYTKGYVNGLENRVEILQQVLDKLRPETDFSDILGSPVPRDSWRSDGMNQAGVCSQSPFGKTREPTMVYTTRPFVAPQVKREKSTHLIFSDEAETDDASSDSDVESLMGAPKFATRPATLKDQDWTYLGRFRGKSSASRIAHGAVYLKHLYRIETLGLDGGPPIFFKSRRTEYWDIVKWETHWSSGMTDGRLFQKVLAQFPPSGLAYDLLDLYFQHINSEFPLLHRPTMFRQWLEALYTKDIWFTCLCCAIFAVSSRYSEDTRVTLEWGRRWFAAAMDIHRLRSTVFYPANLFEIQTYTLLAMFLRGTHSYTSAWVLTSVGLRKAIDSGAHTKYAYSSFSVNDELWRRAWWNLILFDRTDSISLGRAPIGEEDFDLQMPTDVNDEYWETLDFQQPPTIPSRVTAFNLHLNLTQVAAFALKTIYGLNKCNLFLGSFSLTYEEAVAQMDSALQELLDKIPPHLQWRDYMGNTVFSHQSATLFTMYHQTVMLIRRPFIRIPGQSGIAKTPSPQLSATALAKCTESARACARVFDIQARKGYANVCHLVNVVQTAAPILLINLWQNRNRASSDVPETSSPSTQELMTDIEIFVSLLELVEPRFEIATTILFGNLCLATSRKLTQYMLVTSNRQKLFRLVLVT
ncbi:fungal-specific transcription factor domain-containing protein [Mycena floridula]|nr:fungal-specific transcription factor domain-containing protein [Mycena floridula]